MSKELQTQESKDIAAAALAAGWGDQELSSQDVLISKLLPMQGLSKLVTERKAQMGEYRDSVTTELLGSVDAPLEFVPCHVERLWVNKKEVNGKFEFDSMEPVTRENENRGWESIADGVNFRHVYTYLFYVLLPKDIEAGTPKPYTLSFSSTSVKGGKKLMTQMFVSNKQMGLTPASMVMNLDGRIEQNDKGTFVVLDVSSSRKSTNDEVMAALEIYKMVNTGEAKVDHSDITSRNTDNGTREMEF